MKHGTCPSIGVCGRLILYKKFLGGIGRYGTKGYVGGRISPKGNPCSARYQGSIVRLQRSSTLERIAAEIIQSCEWCLTARLPQS